MSVQIRPLRAADTGLVVEIERQAFPTLWPPTPFKRELDNRMARYLVAWEPEPSWDAQSDVSGPGEPGRIRDDSWLSRLIDVLRGRGDPYESPVGADYSLLGFVGLWFMAGETHITSIAVAERCRGKGIGELLLMSSIELAMSRHATVVSLEARVSNHVAQSLYQKYGFEEQGIRKGYYADNREDAVIMTTQPINTPSYQETFRALKEAYGQRYGEIRIVLS